MWLHFHQAWVFVIENLYVKQATFQSGSPIQRHFPFCTHLSTLHDQNGCSDWLRMFIYLFKIHIQESTLKFIVKICFFAGTNKTTIQGCLLAFSLVLNENVNRLALAWEAVVLIFLFQDKRQWFSLFLFVCLFSFKLFNFSVLNSSCYSLVTSFLSVSPPVFSWGLDKESWWEYTESHCTVVTLTQRESSRAENVPVLAEVQTYVPVSPSCRATLLQPGAIQSGPSYCKHSGVLKRVN